LRAKNNFYLLFDYTPKRRINASGLGEEVRGKR